MVIVTHGGSISWFYNQCGVVSARFTVQTIQAGFRGSIYNHRACRDLCRIMLKDAGFLMAVGLVIYLVIGVEKTFQLHREMGGSET